ncbi:MAG TPA: PaaI family thioesterase [Candidatus Dormibacteraeota bacterium]|nr:PaaI family thioesterase [Candidatus Dormibacteraeota bacterium]
MSETKAAPSRAWAWLGIELVETADGSATVQMVATEDMANASGFVHGGMIGALADSAMGRSLRTVKPGVVRAMSFDLKVTFVNAAKIGETLRAKGEVVHAGRRTMVAHCRVEGRGGRLIATASGTFAVTREKES